ncbi:MAG: 1-(5-phosphoribosyl)-5-[(5-phosphoribosylamino)methylideneamino]imidazole-4-carboxamide isomerase [Alphaproteobacteria bacterium]|nr:1-(5-phosphoribosyl)-5-[(5-phosphoribosylamino)methylideneamino]imidazole-4-carboxamide isomerase [Alphaproteobacteria bacterium]
MDLLPAIDLKDGCCVRLKQGIMEDSDTFNDNPCNQAKFFEQEGAKWIHIVDLNGAFAGNPINIDAVKSIRHNVNTKIELGGGIRSLENIENWLNIGVDRIILGTIALKNPDFVKMACDKFPNKIAVGIDCKDGYVAVEGWAETSTVKDVELAKKFENCGVSAIIYTDISRDGVLRGANIEATENLAKSITTPVIISGGISSLSDIALCAKTNVQNITGIITGRALYEHKFTIPEALEILNRKKL